MPTAAKVCDYDKFPQNQCQKYFDVLFHTEYFLVSRIYFFIFSRENFQYIKLLR